MSRRCATRSTRSARSPSTTASSGTCRPCRTLACRPSCAPTTSTSWRSWPRPRTPRTSRILAVARYDLDRRTNLAEVAFVVRDEWQGKGLGTQLFGRHHGGGPGAGHRRLHGHRAGRQRRHAARLPPRRAPHREPARRWHLRADHHVRGRTEPGHEPQAAGHRRRRRWRPRWPTVRGPPPSTDDSTAVDPFGAGARLGRAGVAEWQTRPT